MNEGSQAALPCSARPSTLQLKLAFVIERIDDQPQLFGISSDAQLIGYGFFFGWAGVCFGCSGVGVGLCSRTIFPSQEMYAPMISSRSFFRLNSISAILCSKVLCSSGICWFLSELPYCREVDSLLRNLLSRGHSTRSLGMIAGEIEGLSNVRISSKSFSLVLVPHRTGH